MMRHLSAGPVLAWLLAACSANYSQSASDFSAGISAVHTYSANLAEAVSADREAFYGVERSIHHSRTVRSPSCVDDLSSCYILDDVQQRREKEAARKALAVEAQAAPPPIDAAAAFDAKALGVPSVCLTEIPSVAPLAAAKGKTETKIEPSEDAILDALDTYASGLAAITKQSDIDDYKAAAGKLSASVTALATTAGSIGGGVGGAAGPIAGAVTGIVTEANLVVLETRRYQALRRAVLAACVPVHTLTIAETVILTSRRNDAILFNQEIIQDLLNPATPAKIRAANEAALVRAAANLRAIGPDPAKTVGKISSAHDKLVEAVVSGHGQTTELLAFIGSFADEAKAIRDAAHKSSAKPAAASSS